MKTCHQCQATTAQPIAEGWITRGGMFECPECTDSAYGFNSAHYDTAAKYGYSRAAINAAVRPYVCSHGSKTAFWMLIDRAIAKAHTE